MALALFILLIGATTPPLPHSKEKIAIVTVADTEHYAWVLHLIATLHQTNFDRIEKIVVFDLGLLESEIKSLKTLSKVSVHPIEKAHPDLFTKFIIRNDGKISRGWYSWKPVILKQALDMFPKILYLDSGITMTGPLDLFIEHIEEHGYFFIDCGHTIRRMTKQSLISQFQLDQKENAWILDSLGISAGFQGLSKRLYNSYILPLYHLAHDMNLFIDDGSAPGGFGNARHDQTLFSIFVRLCNFQVIEGVRGQKMLAHLKGNPVIFYLDDYLRFTRSQFDINQTRAFLKYADTQ